jgi:hypothetical protein
LKSLVFLAPSLLVATTFALADCKCSPAPAAETTHYGGNETILFVESTPRSIVEGTVASAVGKVGGALVELFDHGEYLTQDRSHQTEDHPKQTRIAICTTGTDGKFCFPHLPAGHYEIRVSIGSGWDVSSMSVIVDPQKGKRKPLKIEMVIGT